jgi:hypothetical protein
LISCALNISSHGYDDATAKIDRKLEQVRDIVSIVLGIRLFNRQIKKGGAGLADVPALATVEVEELYNQLDKEAADLADVCYQYQDVINVEFAVPGTISSSVQRLRAELTNRRQYVLLVHQLQHEVLDCIDIIKVVREKLNAGFNELKTLIGLRSSVPKEEVYPKFRALADNWLLVAQERKKTTMTAALFKQLREYRASFSSSLRPEDVALLKTSPPPPPDKGEDKECPFVRTLTDANGNDNVDGEIADDVVVRLVKHFTPDFMSLALEQQGYCPWSIVSVRTCE